MGIAMSDTGNGYAVGDVDVINDLSGVLVKHTGNPTWYPVPPSAFTPALNIALTSWVQDVYAIPNSGVAFISWRDDYRSLVYKTSDYGSTWIGISPQNPILYGIRYAIAFRDVREGMIVGEGPGRVHRTTDGGQSWKSYTIPVRAALTDVKWSGTFWYIAGGENSFFRYDENTDRWLDRSFRRSIEFYPTHMKVSFADDVQAYLNGYNSSTGNHVLRTTNGGIDWMPIPAQPNFSAHKDGHKGIFFFDTSRGWVANRYNELAYTQNGGYTWGKSLPYVFGNKTYHPINKLFFLNEAFGWAVGGMQRTDGYPSVSHGYILKWTGTQKPDISSTVPVVSFDTLTCADYKEINVPITNSGTGNLSISQGAIYFSGGSFVLRNMVYPFIIPPGTTREVTIRWVPTSTFYGELPPSAIMHVGSNDVEHSPWDIRLTGLRLLAKLQQEKARIDFPLICRGDSALAWLPVTAVGNSAPRILRVENYRGNGQLRLLSHMIGDPIAPRDSLLFSLRSSRSGVISGSITLEAGDPDCPELIEIPYEGYIESNQLLATPESVDLKDVCVGSEHVEYVELENIGTQKGRVLAAVLVEGDADFHVDIDSAQWIDVNETVQIPVRYSPTARDSIPAGALFALIIGPCPDTVRIALTGRGQQTVIKSTPDSLLIIGPVPLNIDVRRNVLLRNTGTESTALQDVWIDPPVPGLSIIAPTSFPQQFNSGMDLSVELAYRAPAVDSISTTLKYSWSAPCPDTLSLPLLLVSDELPFALLPDSLLFATQICEDPVIDSFMLYNDGQKPLHLKRTDIIGRDPRHFFMIRPQLPLAVPPDSSVVFVLGYDAPVNGESLATLVLRHDDSTSFGESRIELMGHRNVRMLTVLGDTARPLLLCIGTRGSRRFRFVNPHPGTLDVTEIELLSGSPFASLRHTTLPRAVPSQGDFVLDVDVTVPLDTITPVRVRVVMEPCAVEYLLRFDAGVFHPVLQAYPDPLNLGVRAISDTSQILSTVLNTDSIDVEVAGVFLTGVSEALYIADAPVYPFLLRPDSVLPLQLKLRQLKDAGTFAGSLCVILSRPCPDTLCFPLQTIIAEGGLAASADTLAYRFAFCDTLRCDTVHVTNVLTKTQHLQAAVNNSAVYTVTPDTLVTLEEGRSADFIVCSLRPSSAEARGQLLINSTAGNHSTVELHSLRYDGGVLLPDTMDLGNIPTCESERIEEFTIRNTAGLDETLLSAVIDNPAFTLLTALPLIVPANGEIVLRVRCSSPGPGTHSGTLEIYSRIGDCERWSSIVVHARHADSYIETTPSTLLFANVVAGSSQTRSIHIRNRDMQGLRLLTFKLNSDPPFTTSFSTPVTMDVGTTLDIPVSFRPDSVGDYFGSLCLIFDRPCPDTVCIAIEGMAVDGALVFGAPELLFDALAQCEEQVLTIPLSNSGSTSVKLQSSTLSGGGAAAYTIENPVTANEVLAGGAQRDFRLRFAPSMVPDGPVTAALFVSTDAATQPVVELPLSGTRVTQVTPPDVVLDIGLRLLGSTVQLRPYIFNQGSSALQLTGLRMPASYTPVTVLPAAVPSADSLQLDLRLQPDTEGSLSDTLYVIVSPCLDSLRIIVRGTITRQFIQTDAEFGEVPVCETAVAPVTLMNNGSTTMEVTNLRIAGVAANRFALIAPPALPLSLAPGTSEHLSVQFDPEDGDRGTVSAELVTQVTIDGESLEFRSVLRALVFDGGLDFSSTAMLGASTLGAESAPVDIAGHNRSAYPVTVESVAPFDPQLRVLGTVPALPSTVQPGDSLVVQVAFTPNRQGMIDDSLQLTASSPCNVKTVIPVLYEGMGDLLPVTLRAGDVTGAVDDTVDIPVYLTETAAGLSVTRWSGALRYNASMLYPVAVRTAGTMSDGMQTTLSWDHTTGTASMIAEGGRLQPGTDILTYLRCQVLVGNDSTTVISPAEFTFSHPAIAVDLVRSGRFDLTDFCLIDGRRLVSLRGEGMLGRSAPNPTRGMTRIDFTLTTNQPVCLSLYDTQGRKIAVLAEGMRHQGRHEVIFDASGYPAGQYLYVLELPNGLEARKLTIVH